MAGSSETSSVPFLVTVVTNVFPVAAVFALGWDAEMLAVVYVVQLLVAVPFAGLKALFAAQPPDYEELTRPKEPGRFKSDDREGTSVGPSELNRRRGSVGVVDWLPPVYPRNASFVTGWFGTVVTLSAVFVAVLGQSVDVLATLTEPTVAASTVSLVVSHVAVIERQYFRERQYETVTPQDVVEAATGEASVAAAVFLVASGVGPTGAVVVFAAVKLYGEWLSYRGESLTGDDREPGELPPVSVPKTVPTAVVRPNGRAVVAAALWRGVEPAIKFLPGFALVWGALTRASAAGPLVALACFGLGPALVVGLRAVEYWLTHGTLAYQRRGDTIIAYDELTETPQWSVPVDELQRVELRSRHLTDRLFDTRTFTIRPLGAEYDHEITHVEEYERAVEAFELPVAAASLGRLDWRAVGATVGLAVGVVTAAGWTLTRAPSAAVFLVAFGSPLSLVVFRWMWRQGVPQTRVDVE